VLISLLHQYLDHTSEIEMMEYIYDILVIYHMSAPILDHTLHQ
jgi:hypothetical protein